MSAISPYQLSNAILNGLEQSGASSTLLSRPTKQPREEEDHRSSRHG